MTDRNVILDNLDRFLHMRPNLDFRLYGDISLYRRDYREHCEKPLHDGRKLLNAVGWRKSIIGDDIVRASETAFSGRLDISEEKIDYTPGQMAETEYRHAVCAVLASALWEYFRSDWEGGPESGKDLRKHIHRSLNHELGRGTLSRYFD